MRNTPSTPQRVTAANTRPNALPNAQAEHLPWIYLTRPGLGLAERLHGAAPDGRIPTGQSGRFLLRRGSDSRGTARYLPSPRSAQPRSLFLHPVTSFPSSLSLVCRTWLNAGPLLCLFRYSVEAPRPKGAASLQRSSSRGNISALPSPRLCLGLWSLMELQLPFTLAWRHEQVLVLARGIHDAAPGGASNEV